MACVSRCLCLSPRLTPKSDFSSNKKSLIHLKSPLDRYSFPKRGLSTRNGNGISVVKAASIDKVSGAGGLVESDKLPSDLRKRAMEAVDECDLRVTVGDVASRGGLNVTEAQKALQALAADTDGFLEVSDEGDVLYVLPRDYRSKLAAKSFRIKIEPSLEKAKVVVGYLIRVIVYTTIIVIIFNIISVVIASYYLASFFRSLDSLIPHKYIYIFLLLL